MTESSKWPMPPREGCCILESEDICQPIGKSQERLAVRGCLERQQGLMVLDEAANPTVSVGGLFVAAERRIETEAGQTWYNG